MILLSTGIILLSLTLTYAWWTRVRVVLLRQDIFDARDELFDRAIALSATNDAAYQAARHHLNAIAKSAEHLNPAALAYVLHLNVDDFARAKTRTANEPLQVAIDDALLKTARRISRYFLRHCLAGWVLCVLVRLVRMAVQVQTQTYKWSYRWVMSGTAEDVVGDKCLKA